MLTYFVGAALVALFAPRPQVVVVETDPFLLPLLGRCLQRWHGCRLVVYLQDIYPDVAIAVGKVRDGWFTRLLRRSLFAVYRRADRVIVLGEDMRALLTDSGIPDERITSLPNWVDTTRIAPVPVRNRFREREQLDGKFVVMYSGNMGLCQNLDEILETAQLLRDRPQIELVLIGGGASRARLEETARAKQLPNVRFRDYQPLAELAHSLKRGRRAPRAARSPRDGLPGAEQALRDSCGRSAGDRDRRRTLGSQSRRGRVGNGAGGCPGSSRRTRRRHSLVR